MEPIINELVPSISIDALLNHRASAIDHFTRGITALQTCQRIFEAAQIDGPHIGISQHAYENRDLEILGHHAESTDDLMAFFIRHVDIAAWRRLMHESGLRTFMDATARQAWDKQLDKGDVPELTKNNINATFSNLYQARGDMFERGVIECFKRLSWSYKTNQPFKLGHKIILTAVIDSWGSPNSNRCDLLDDLIRVMHLLDHKPEPDHRQGLYALIHQHRGQGQFETEYVCLKWFKKGTAHMTFKRQDLVDQMNAIIAKHYPNALASEVR